MANYANWLQEATKNKQDVDLTSVEHAKKQLLLSLLNEEDVKARGQKNDLTGSPVSPYVHGGGGLLNIAGAYPTIFSAMVQPLEGMGTALPRLDNQIPFPDSYGGYDSPKLVTLTGQTEGDLADSANQPNAICDDAPTSGLLKTCTRLVEYGRYSGETRQLALSDVGRLVNSSEPTDFSIANNIQVDSPFLDENTSMTGGNWINDEWRVRMVEVGNDFLRLIMPQIYTGDPNNNSAGGGYREIQGFDLFYTDEARDISGIRCPAADSLILNWNASISSTNLQGRYLYQYLEDVHDYLRNLAETVGINPVRWQISMDRDLFRELCQIFPVQQYVRMISTLTTLNGAGFASSLNMSAREEQAYRQQMFQGRFLPLNGEMVPVTVETASNINATYNAATNTRTSKIYFHPMTVRGNIPVNYWQFRNQANAKAMQVANATNGMIKFTDNGKFVWTFNLRNGCVTWRFVTEPRIMVHTPFLAAVIEGVQYSPTLFSRDYNPNNSSFYANGGNTSTPVQYGVTDWSSGTSVALTFPEY